MHIFSGWKVTCPSLILLLNKKWWLVVEVWGFFVCGWPAEHLVTVMCESQPCWVQVSWRVRFGLLDNYGWPGKGQQSLSTIFHVKLRYFSLWELQNCCPYQPYLPQVQRVTCLAKRLSWACLSSEPFSTPLVELVILMMV